MRPPSSARADRGGPVRFEPPDYVVLVVEELDRALDFYCDVLGLPLGHRSGPYAQLDTGVTRLSLFERQAMAATLGRDLDAPSPEAPAFELGFKVDDCDAAYTELVAAGAQTGRSANRSGLGSAHRLRARS